MTNGYIKIHRKFMCWGWYQNSQAVHLFVHLLLEANHADAEWQGYDVKRGQLITSIGHISIATGISQQSVRTLLKKFEKSGEIIVKSTNKFTLVTICKYDDYQSNEVSVQQTNNKQLTNEQQTTNKQLTTNKKNKEELRRKEEEEIYIHFDHLSISTAEHQKLIDAGYTEQQVHEIYQDIQNYKGNKNYKSLYLTALKWLGMNKTKEQAKTANPKWLIAHGDNIMQICETEEQAKKALENIKSQLKHCPYEVRFEANFVSQYERLVF